MQLNPMRPFMGLFAMCVVGYVVYIFVSGDPLTRMNRICRPVTKWPARVVVSGAHVFAPSHATPLQADFDAGFLTCRRWVWGALYEPEYKKEKAAQARRRASRNEVRHQGGGRTETPAHETASTQ